MAMKLKLRIGRLGLTLVLVAGCAPSPDVLQAGARREAWNPSTTRSPPAADAAPPAAAPPDAASAPAPIPGRDAAAPPRDAAPAAPPPSGPAQTCKLTFQVTTVSFGGNYAPRNVGAIWIADGNGRFVKSLTVWGRRRVSHLERWESVSGGSTVDAITSATAGNHGTRMASWDCTGANHQPVAAGAYSVNVEFTEQNGPGRVMTPLPFTTGTGPVDATPGDQGSFKNVHLQVAP